MVTISNTTNNKVQFNPTQILIIGFVSLILAGAVLLNLPLASKSGENVGFLNALFTSTSAICVTGLVVVDTGTYWTLFGQIVILSLIQIGGLGFMAVATFLSLIVGRKIGLKERLIIQESLHQDSLQGIVNFTKQIVILTIIVELLGALLLLPHFMPQLGFKNALYFSLFHSVSAFNNSGFDIMGQITGPFTSLTSYVNNATVNFTIMGLIIIGSLGFFVLKDLFESKSLKKLSLHSKVVILITTILIVFGAMFFFISEHNNPNTMGTLSFKNQVMASIFQPVTRTTGFSTIPFDNMTNASKFMTIILMFIGGSPGSTAGGVKTVTVGILVFTLISTIKGKENVEVFKKRLPQSLINKSLSIILINMFMVILITIILSFQENTSFMNMLFEATSAVGTVGLSLGITPYLSALSKLVITFAMFFGRIGPLSIALALSIRARNQQSKIKYPEDRIMVG